MNWTYTSPKKQKNVILFVICLTIITLINFNSYGQVPTKRIYANTVEKSKDDKLLVVVTAGQVTDKDKAVDRNTATAATLTSTVVNLLGVNIGGVARIRLRFTGTDKPVANTPVTIKLGLGGNLLSILDGVTVQAVNGPATNDDNTGNQVGQEYKGSQIVNILGGEDQVEFTITPSQAYDGVLIKLGAPKGILSAGVITTAQVFHAYFTKPATVVCNTPLDVLHGSTGSLAGGLNGVTNAENAIDGNDETSALLRANASVLNKTHITSIYPVLSKPNDSIRIVLQPQGTGLLDATVLTNNFAIRTYNGNTSNGAIGLNNTALLKLNLLGGSTSNKYVLTYPIATPFDRIEVALGDGLASVLNGVYIYEIGRFAPSPVVESPGLIKNILTTCEGTPVNIKITNPEAGAIYRYFDAPTGGNEITAGVTENGAVFSPVGLTAGTHNFYVALYRNGCTDPISGRTKFTIIITGGAKATDILADGISICDGEPVTLSASLAVPGSIANPVFTYYFDAAKTEAITDGVHNGATYTINPNRSITITGLTATTDYFVSVQGPNVCENAPGALKTQTVTVNTSVQPTLNLTGTQNFPVGGTLSLQATSTGAVSYQWYKDGVAIPSETTATLTRNNLATTDAGSYYSIAIGAGGCPSIASASVVINISGLGSTKTVAGTNVNGAIEAGSELTYSIKITNPSSSIVNGVLISDVIPAGTSYVMGSASNSGVLTGNTLSWTVNIPAASDLTVTFKATATADLTGIAAITNTADVTIPGDPDIQHPSTGPIPTNQLAKFSSAKTVAGLVGGKIVAGSELTYTINIKNDGNVSLTGIKVSDVIPAGISYVASSASNGGTLTNNTLNWVIAIPVGQQVPITFKVKVTDNLTGIASIGNTATVTNPTDPDHPQHPTVPPAPTTQLRTFTTVKTVSDITGGKITAGSELIYAISVTNTGNVDLTGISITDAIPAGTSYVVGSADNGGTLNGAILSYVLDVPFGQTKTVTFKVKVADDLTGIASIGNTATVTDPTDPTHPETPTVPPTPTDQTRSFTSTKTVSGLTAGNKIAAGSELTYSIKIVNTGNVALTGIKISDVMPTGTTYVTGSADNSGALTGTTLNWTIDIPFGQTKAVTFKVKVADDLTGIASIGNTATVTDPTDPTHPEHPEVPPTPTDQQPDFELTSTVAAGSSDGKAHAGDVLTYVITVKNTGNVALTNTTITDPVPNNTVFTSAQNGGTLDAINKAVGFTIPTIGVGASATVSFTVTVNSDLTNTTVISNIATVKNGTIEKTTLADIPVVCTTTSVTEVTVNGTPGGDVCIVQGANVEIKATSSGVTNPVYYLYNGTTLVTTNTTGIFSVVVTAGTSYTYLIGISGDGICESLPAQRKSITFTANIIPGTPTVAATSVKVCLNSPAVLSVSNPITGITYNWYTLSTGGILAGSGADFTTPDVTASTSYFVEAISTGGCSNGNRTEVKVEAIPLPIAPATVVVNDGPSCSGYTSVLSVSNPDPSLIYNWYTTSAGGTIAGSGTTFTTPSLTTTTIYYVESVSETGCMSTSRTPVTATVLSVLSSPVVVVKSTTPNSITFGWAPVPDATGYEVSLDGGITWQTPSSGAAGITQVISNLKPAAIANIRVRAKGQKECQTSAVASLDGTAANPLGNGVYVPNTFTPNGDGKNDFFYIYGNTIAKMRLKVYNQWGQLIFESQKIDYGWDGTHQGQLQPNGVYVYYADVTFNDGTTKIKKGTVTLLR